MRYAIIINSSEPETVWNALRFATAVLSRGHKATIFLLGPAVEINRINSERFNIKKILQRYIEMGGEALSCGTCLRIRDMDASEACPMSSMDELVRITEEADRTVIFG